MSADYIADTFRRWGHLKAELDSFSRMPSFPHEDLDSISPKDAKKWQKIYCGHVGTEFMHMPYPARCKWLAEKLENPQASALTNAFALKRIAQAELLEKFIHTRYVGSKRFSLDGLAVMIPTLDAILTKAANLSFKTVVIGMSHRGRLNTMVNIVGIPPSTVFAGFEDVDPKSVLGSGDVKYHKGATGTYTTQDGKTIDVHLASNPSHLEAINPAVLGRVKAKQTRLNDTDHNEVLAIILHGDAAFAGQGINAETLNYMELPGFKIGGTIHLVINNLIGFTAIPESLYSSRYCTDIAKRLPIPIFHVNGEYPEDATRIAELATDYKHTFKSDVVIDLIGYRRYGHSEIDNPTLTLPKLYKEIQKHPYLYQSFASRISVSENDVKALEDEINSHLDHELDKGRKATKQPAYATLPGYWSNYIGGYYSKDLEVDTSVTAQTIEAITESITTFPEQFALNPKLRKGFAQRLDMGTGKRPIDWAMGEQLAFGSLLLQGTRVRLTGQDSCRGTFNHRQSVVVDTETGERYFPLCHLSDSQGQFEVYDSMLSEAAALGYEYGFSRDFPEALVCWEAQFGDFANGAQIIIDQFVTAGEDKWNLLSGLVMLLPHGYEGQGPEHSSARMERYLQVAGEDNIQVTYPSSASQIFHLLRRQALRKWRKPLIVFTPKSMLRLPAACSPRDEFINGSFKQVKGDTEDFTKASRLLICSGKIAHELRSARKSRSRDDVAVITLEQLYPFPEDDLRLEIAKYQQITSIVWVQEEPANMGPLYYVRPILERLAGGIKVLTVRRSTSASPATGSAKAHAMEQDALIRLAFANYSHH